MKPNMLPQSSFRIMLLILVCQFVINTQVFGQDFDLSIKKDRQEIDGITYVGYSTAFGVSKSEIQKIWWKYSKQIGVLDNRKNHYIIRVPATEKGLSSVSLLQTSDGDNTQSTIFLAVLDQTNNSFKEQVEKVLLEFKIKYFADKLASQIREKEQALALAGKKYNQLVSAKLKQGANIEDEENTGALEDVIKLSYELEQLKRSLNDIR